MIRRVAMLLRCSLSLPFRTLTPQPKYVRNGKYLKLFADKLGKVVLRKRVRGLSDPMTMKRRAPVEFKANPRLSHSADSRSKEPPAHRQRQPQTSCDFCRLKKLKCDRAQPCSTCVTRGRPCDGPPVPTIANHGQSTLGDTPQAVFTSVRNSRLPSVYVFYPKAS